jgi:hypothetical protein
MKGFSLISFCVLYVGVFLFINLGESNKLDITYTKEELEAILKKLVGNDESAVPHFLFFDKESLTNYSDTKGPPRNRTELRRSKRPKPRDRSDAEVTLGKALNRLQHNKSVGVITRWARLLHVILFEANFTSEIQECVSQKTLGIGFGENGCPSVPKTKTKSCNRRRLRKKRRHWNRYRNRRYRSDEDDDDNEAEENKEDEREDYHQKEPQAEVADRSKYVNVPRSYGPVQTADFERMRRSLTYTYETDETCYKEGDTGTTTDTVYLCNVCYKTVNFGTSVIPQYANSVECVDSMPNCLGGDGSCTQKVIYYTLQQQTSEKEWESISQALNVSCECECTSNSLTHTTMVGNSNW